MAVKQVFGNMYEYVCVDNAAAQSFPTLSDKTHCGYDTMSVVPGFGAAVNQAASSLGSEINQSQPDFVEDQTAIATGLVLVSLGYKNPS
jgi:hypothetical protein